jgi:DNA-directed RNA polymerase specialized sigma24 family protein
MLNNETIKFLLPYIKGTVAKVLGKRLDHNIEDVVNDTLAALSAGGLERFEGRSSLKAYAMTSAKNNAVNFKARMRNHGHESVDHTDGGSDQGAEYVGNMLEGCNGQLTVERSAKATSLAFALECLLDTDEAEFMQAMLTGTTAGDAATQVGWSAAKGSRKRKALTAYLAEYVSTGKWEE